MLLSLMMPPNYLVLLCFSVLNILLIGGDQSHTNVLQAGATEEKGETARMVSIVMLRDACAP